MERCPSWLGALYIQVKYHALFILLCCTALPYDFSSKYSYLPDKVYCLERLINGILSIQIKTNEEMRDEIIIEAYVSGIDAFFYVDSDSVDEILSNNPDVNPPIYLLIF
jgi:hypothetical protein